MANLEILDGIHAAHFSPDLLHKTDLLQQQLEYGQYTFKRTKHYLQKIIKIQKQAAKDMLKVSMHEESKFPRIDNDDLTPHCVAYKALTSFFLQMANQQMAMAGVLEEKVYNVMHKQYNTQVSHKKAKVVSADKKLQNSIAKLTKTLSNARNTALKDWKNLQNTRKTFLAVAAEPPSSSRDNKKLKASRNYDSNRTKTFSSFRKMEDILASSILERTRLETNDRDAILREIEMCETFRLEAASAGLQQFVAAMSTFLTPLEGNLKTCEQRALNIDARATLSTYTKQLVHDHGTSTVSTAEFYCLGLPTDADVIAENGPELTTLLKEADLSRLVSQHEAKLNPVPSRVASKSVMRRPNNTPNEALSNTRPSPSPPSFLQFGGNATAPPPLEQKQPLPPIRETTTTTTTENKQRPPGPPGPPGRPGPPKRAQPPSFTPQPPGPPARVSTTTPVAPQGPRPPPAREPEPEVERQGTWNCVSCAVQNELNNMFCMECGTSQNAVAEPETIPAVVEEELVDDVVDSKEQEQWQDTENEVEDEYCEALHDFVNEDTTSFLNFKKGDLICVMLKDPSGWWRGCKAVGSTWSAEAAFPGNYVIPKITKIVSVDKMN